MDSDPQRLRAARGWAGLTQHELGRRLGRNKQYVARRERDPDKPGSYPLSEADRIAVAHICGLPLQWFYVDIPELLSRIPLEAPVVGPIPRYRRPPDEDQQQEPGARPSEATDQAQQ